MTTSHSTKYSIAGRWAQPQSKNKHTNKSYYPVQPAPMPVKPLEPIKSEDVPEDVLPADDLIELTTPTLTAEDIPWEFRLVYQPHLHRWPT